MASQWIIFLQTIQTSVGKTDFIVKATIYLCIFLRQTNSAGYSPARFVDSYDDSAKIKEGEWRSSIKRVKGNAMFKNDILTVRGSRPTKLAVDLLDLVKSYVN